MKENILVFGDSNTYGLIPGTNSRYDEKTRYTGILKQLLTNYNIIEDGVVGRTTTFSDYREGKVGIDFIENAINNSNPKYIVIMLGTNDLKSKNGYNETLINSSMKRFLDKIENAKNTSKVIIISPINLADNIEDLDKDFNHNSYILSLKLKSIYKKLSSLYNYYFLDASIVSSAGIDGEHMSELGHYNLGNTLANYIKNIESHVN